MHKPKVQCQEAGWEIHWGPRYSYHYLWRAPFALCLPIFSHGPIQPISIPSTHQEVQAHFFTGPSPSPYRRLCSWGPIKCHFGCFAIHFIGLSTRHGPGKHGLTRVAWRHGAIHSSEPSKQCEQFSHKFFLFFVSFSSNITSVA